MCKIEAMRMGRVLGLVAAALAVLIGGLVLAVYVTRDEDNIQVDNVLSENISKAIAQSEDPDVGTDGVVDLRRVADFDWDRVLVVAPTFEGTPDDLPPGRREKYEASGRNSKVLVKKIPKTPKPEIASALT